MEVGEDATNNTGYWAYNANPNYYTPNDLRHSTADARLRNIFTASNLIQVGLLKIVL